MEEGNATKRKTDWKNFREWLQVFIIIAATLIGAYEFVYKDVYKPSIRPSSLNVQANMELVGTKESMSLIRCKIITENPTDRRIYIPAFWLTVRACTIDEEIPDLLVMNKDLKEENNELKAENKELQHAIESIYPGMSHNDLDLIKSQFMENLQSSPTPYHHDTSTISIQQKVSGKMVFQKKLVQDSFSWWEPMDKTTNEYVFAIPAGMYDYLEMSVNYFHTRFIDDINEPHWSKLSDSSYMVSFFLKEHGADATAFDKWQKETASGYNWSVTTLPLWKK